MFQPCRRAEADPSVVYPSTRRLVIVPECMADLALVRRRQPCSPGPTRSSCGLVDCYARHPPPRHSGTAFAATCCTGHADMVLVLLGCRKSPARQHPRHARAVWRGRKPAVMGRPPLYQRHRQRGDAPLSLALPAAWAGSAGPHTSQLRLRIACLAGPSYAIVQGSMQVQPLTESTRGTREEDGCHKLPPIESTTPRSTRGHDGVLQMSRFGTRSVAPISSLPAVEHAKGNKRLVSRMVSYRQYWTSSTRSFGATGLWKWPGRSGTCTRSSALPRPERRSGWFREGLGLAGTGLDEADTRPPCRAFWPHSIGGSGACLVRIAGILHKMTGGLAMCFCRLGTEKVANGQLDTDGRVSPRGARQNTTQWPIAVDDSRTSLGP